MPCLSPGGMSIPDGIPEKPSNSEVLRRQDREDTACICVGVLGSAGVPPAAGGPVRFISPTPPPDGQQSGCAGQALTPLLETPSLPWGGPAVLEQGWICSAAFN